MLGVLLLDWDDQVRSLPDQAQGGAGGRQGGGDYLQLATIVPGHTKQHLILVVEDLDQQKLTLVVQVDRVTGDERPGLGHKLPFCQVELVICNIFICVDISFLKPNW